MRNCNQMEFLNSMVPTPHGAIIECDAVLAYTITQDPQTLTCTCTNWGSWEKTDPRQSVSNNFEAWCWEAGPCQHMEPTVSCPYYHVTLLCYFIILLYACVSLSIWQTAVNALSILFVAEEYYLWCIFKLNSCTNGKSPRNQSINQYKQHSLFKGSFL